MLNDQVVDRFDPEELKEWEKDPRGAAFWAELSRMFEERVSAIRSELHSGQSHEATLLAGQLEAIEEIMQLPSVLVQQQEAADTAAKEPTE